MALRINEIFKSLQGESTFAGLPCTFIRLTGCGLRCSYCDTTYAYDEGEDFTIEELLQKVRSHSLPLVQITGGEPLEQEEVYPLIENLLEEGMEVLIETNGAINLTRLNTLRERGEALHVIMDIKTPGSKMEKHNRWENFTLLKAGDEVKFVLLDRKDYLWAVNELKKVDKREKVTFLFSPGEGKLAPSELSRWILEDGLDVRLNLQLHKIIWGSEKRGV